MKSLSYYFDSLPLGTGRASTIQVLKTCDGFAQSMIRVTLYAPIAKGVTPEQIREEYRLHQNLELKKIFYFPYSKFILGSLNMLKHFLKDKNEIIYTRNIYFALLTAFLTKRIIVYEAHQYNFLPSYHTLFQLIFLKFLITRNNFSLVVVCEALKQKFKENGITGRIFVCGNGFEFEENISDISNATISRGTHRAIALYAGSLKRIKGLKHIEYLAVNNRDVIFYLIGSRDNYSDKYLVEKFKQYKNVTFLGYISHREISNYLKMADILLLLPTRDGIYNDVTSPLKLFEYMHAGRPILATNIPSLKEILKSKYNALLAQDDDEDIDVKFKTLLNDENLRNILGNNAKRDAAQYSWRERTRRIKDYILG